MTTLEEKMKVVLKSPCCNDLLIPVMESAGSYLGDDFAGMECLECANSWDTEGNLSWTSHEVTTKKGDLVLFGHPDEIRKNEKVAEELAEKYDIDTIRKRFQNF